MRELADPSSVEGNRNDSPSLETNLTIKPISILISPQNEEHTCFVCWETSPRSKLIRPCKCTSDDLRFAHQECMLRYLDLHHQKYRTKYQPITQRQTSFSETRNSLETSYTFPSWIEWKNERVPQPTTSNPTTTTLQIMQSNLMYSLILNVQFTLWLLAFLRFQISSPLEQQLGKSARQTQTIIPRSTHQCSVCKHPYRIIVQKLPNPHDRPEMVSSLRHVSTSHVRKTFKTFLKILIPVALLMFLILLEIFPYGQSVSYANLASFPANTPIHISMKIESADSRFRETANLDIRLSYPSDETRTTAKTVPSYPQFSGSNVAYGYQTFSDSSANSKYQQYWSDMINLVVFNVIFALAYFLLVVCGSFLILKIWNGIDDALQPQTEAPVMMEEGILRLEDGEVLVWTVEEYSPEGEDSSSS